MQFVMKLSISIAVIVICSQVGRKFPSLAGLIATMPLTGLIVLIWLYSENPENYDVMIRYTLGALFGIVPSILFFVVVFFCFRKHLPLHIILSAGFGVWLIGAFGHQWLLK
ncbi:MAG: DUF3147 family protein [Deltaproteobacteria bacterium]|nr:DUF3147 family protein [Deltaproteobacteria bacterium]